MQIWCLLLLLLIAPAAASPPSSLTAEEIVAKSASLVRQDWERAPQFDFCSTETTDTGATTHAVLMTAGSPYYRLVGRNHEPLSPAEETSEQSRYEVMRQQSRAETSDQRSRRVAAYQSERLRNQLLLEEFTDAMRFELTGTTMLMGRRTYVVHALPKPGYRPKSRETRVLTGAEGTMWIDQDSLRWVRVHAEVTRPVAIQGFLATVRPGTEFELEEAPVGNGIWLASHFSVSAKVKLFFLFHRTYARDEQYFNYRPAGTLKPESCLSHGGNGS